MHPAIVIRVSFGSCPCDNFFVGLHTGVWAQPVGLTLLEFLLCFTLILTIMAIINSLAIGKSVKSAGNLTYKTVRGRTIASQRITTNSSNTILQAAQRGLFGRSVQCMQLVLPWVNNFFEKTKYGSARNQFLKLNKKYTLGGYYSEITEGVIPLVEGFVTEAVSPSIPFTSYGTLAAVVSETAATDNEITVGGTPYTVNAALSTLYNFTTAVDKKDVRILFYGFVKPTAETVETTLSPIYKSYTLDEVAKLESECHMAAIVTQVDNDTVSSIELHSSSEQPLDFGYMVGYCVVSVGGKLPRTNKIFILTV